MAEQINITAAKINGLLQKSHRCDICDGNIARVIDMCGRSPIAVKYKNNLCFECILTCYSWLN